MKFGKSLVGIGLLLALLISLGVYPSPNMALASNTDFLPATAIHTPNSWLNPDKAFVSDDQYATSNDLGNQQGYSNFDFDIPANSQINGIQIKIDAHASVGWGCMLDARISGDNGNHYTKVKAQPLLDSDTTLIFGGSNDLWDQAWTDSDFSDSKFVLDFEFGNTKHNSCGFVSESHGQEQYNVATISVDQVTARVFYTSQTKVVEDPSLAQSCGLDIALVLDNSGSIGNNLGLMKKDFKNFVADLSPATSTQFSVTYFNTVGHVQQAFTPNSVAVKNAIDNVPSASGFTNWENGLAKASSTFDPRPTPNLIIFASDGQPNHYGDRGHQGNGTFDQDALNAAISEANIIKLSGIRIVSIGIGHNIDKDNLKAISGSDAYYSANDFDDLANVLQTIAKSLCGGTLTVTKRIGTNSIDFTGAGMGWTFDIGGASETTDINGQTPAVHLANGTYRVAETGMVAGYSFGSASCSGATDNGFQDSYGVSGIKIGTNDVVSCIVYNTADPGTLKVIKTVSDQSADPSEFTLRVQNGTPGQFQGSQDGVSVTIPAGTSYQVTEDTANGYSADFSQNCSGVMSAGGSSVCNVTNSPTVSTKGSLTVTKIVINDNGGTKQVSDYTLSVTDKSDINTDIVSGISNDFDPGSYTVSESDHAGYLQDFSGDCNDNGLVNIEAGKSYVCTITNNDIQPQLTVTKIVQGSNVSPLSFPLFVSPQEGDPVSIVSSAAQGFDAGIYTVSETNQDGFTGIFSGDCNAEGTVVLNVGDVGNCVLTNTFTNNGGGEGGTSEHVLTVTVTADEGASGTVMSDDSLINCTLGSSENCAASYGDGAHVTLTAVPGENSSFTGTWTTGPCSGSDNPICSFSMNSDTAVNAHFSISSNTSGGGGGGCIGNCGGGPAPTGIPTITPPGQVLGITTPTQVTTPPGKTLGATTLPRTGQSPIAVYILLAIGLLAVFFPKRYLKFLKR